MPDQRLLDEGIRIAEGTGEPGAPTLVSLDYRSGRTCLTVQNRTADPDPTDDSLPAPHGLTTVGGRHGLAGLSERLEQVGGTLHAGPHPDGWQVDVELPA